MVHRLRSILPFCQRRPSFGRGVREPRGTGRKPCHRLQGTVPGAGYHPVVMPVVISPGGRITGTGREEDQEEKQAGKMEKAEATRWRAERSKTHRHQKRPVPLTGAPEPQSRRMTPRRWDKRGRQHHPDRPE